MGRVVGGGGRRGREGTGGEGLEGRRGEARGHPLVITFKGGIGGDVGGITRPSNLKVSRAPLHDGLPPPLEAHDEPQQPCGADGAEQLEDSPVWKQGCSASWLFGVLFQRHRPCLKRLPQALVSLGQSVA